MKTFSRKRSSSVGSRDTAPLGANNSRPKDSSGDAGPRTSPNWSTLPDGPLLLVARALPSCDRPGCRLVCRGWATATGVAVEQVALHLSPLPREAARQLAAAHQRFPAATQLTLTFPNFLLPAPASAPGPPPASAFTTSAAREGAQRRQDQQQHQQQRQPQRQREYAAPLLGAATAAAAAAGGGGGCFAGLTQLTLVLGVAGQRALPLEAFYRLPHLRRLMLRGLTPQAGAGAAAGTSERLGLAGFPRLEDLTLAGLLSYRVLLEAAQVTSLRHLALEGLARLERSEFMFLAALRRLSTLTQLEGLTVNGPIFTCVNGGGDGGAEAVEPRLDGAAALGSVLAHLTCLTSLNLASGPHSAMTTAASAAAAAATHTAAGKDDADTDRNEDEGSDDGDSGSGSDGGEDIIPGGGGGVGGMYDNNLPRRVACSWRSLLLVGGSFAGLTELTLTEPGRLYDGFWADLASLRSYSDGSVGGGGGGCLRSLSLTAASSGIVDELPSGLRGLTKLHLAGVQLDSFAVLTRLRCLADLRLQLPPEGCDAARRHNVALLAALGGLTRLELRSGSGGGGAAAAGTGLGAEGGGAVGRAGAGGRVGLGGAAGPRLAVGVGAHGGGAREAAGAGVSSCGEQLLLNDARLAALARGCRRLAAFSFRGTLQLTDTGLAALSGTPPPPPPQWGPPPPRRPPSARRDVSANQCVPAAASGLTSLELFNDSDAPSVVSLHLLPPSLERLSLYSVTLALPPLPPPPLPSKPPPPHLPPEPPLPVSGGTDTTTVVGCCGGCRAGSGQWGLPPASHPAAPAAAVPLPESPTQPQLLLLPRCRVLHLDYCRGAPAWRLLPYMGSGAGAGVGAGGGVGAGSGCGVLEELRLQYHQAGALTTADAAAVAALPRLRKLQVSCQSGVVSDFVITRMLTSPSPSTPTSASSGATQDASDASASAAAAPTPPSLTCLSLRLPYTALSLANLRALGRLSSLRSLYLDAPPPRDVGLMVSELRGLAALTALTLGPVYGRDCSRHPGLLAALGQLQVSLLTCRIQQAC